MSTFISQSKANPNTNQDDKYIEELGPVDNSEMEAALKQLKNYTTL